MVFQVIAPRGPINSDPFFANFTQTLLLPLLSPVFERTEDGYRAKILAPSLPRASNRVFSDEFSRLSEAKDSIPFVRRRNRVLLARVNQPYRPPPVDYETTVGGARPPQKVRIYHDSVNRSLIRGREAGRAHGVGSLPLDLQSSF